MTGFSHLQYILPPITQQVIAVLLNDVPATVACRNIGERVEKVRPANFLRSWACEKNFSHDKGYLSRNVEIWVNAVLLDDVLDDYEM